jgi:TPR repeat protein
MDDTGGDGQLALMERYLQAQRDYLSDDSARTSSGYGKLCELSQLGHGRSSALLSVAHRFGFRDAFSSFVKSEEFYTKAIQSGCEFATLFGTSWSYSAHGDLSVGVHQVFDLIEAGDPDPLLLFLEALIWRHGYFNNVISMSDAFRATQLAVERDFVFSLNALAHSYEQGHGVEKDTNLGEALYSRGAELGIQASYYNVAVVHWRRAHEPENRASIDELRVKAGKMFERAAEEGSPGAMHACFEARNHGHTTAKDDAIVLSRLRRAVELGYVASMVALVRFPDPQLNQRGATRRLLVRAANTSPGAVLMLLREDEHDAPRDPVRHQAIRQKVLGGLSTASSVMSVARQYGFLRAWEPVLIPSPL